MVKVHREALEIIAEEFGVSVKDILSCDKARSIARARQATCLVLKHKFMLSQPETGRILGLDKSTVWHALKRCALLIEHDDFFSERIDRAMTRVVFGKRFRVMKACSTISATCYGAGVTRIR